MKNCSYADSRVCVNRIISRKYLSLGFMLNHAAGSIFTRPDLKIVTTSVLCRQRYQLQFTCQLVVLCYLQLRLGGARKQVKSKGQNVCHWMNVYYQSILTTTG